ncbi:MAG: hypothetical protein PHN66_00635 [Candidatus Shapirobacteria bacterium]|jgi:hypothetical protein|nr:hypothetical protein [Candidatus Shapirobacteria bacterium]
MSSQIEETLEQISKLLTHITELQAAITCVINHFPEFFENNPNL